MNSISIYFRIIFTFVITVAFVSCKEKTIFSTDLIKVDVNKFENTNFDENIVTMSFVQLEETPNHKTIIGEIDKVIMTNKSIYVLDSRKSRTIFIYDLQGKFKQLINNTGSGKGEYISIDDFQVDEQTSEIIICDGNQRKLLFYDYNGKYLREIKIDCFFLRFALLGKNKIVIHKGNTSSSEPYYLKIIDRLSGETNKEIMPIRSEREQITLQPKSTFNIYNDTLRYLPDASNSLYEIVNHEAHLKYTFDFGSKTATDDIYGSINKQDPYKMYKTVSENYVILSDVVETKSYLYYWYHFPKIPTFAFIDKQTNLTHAFRIKPDDIIKPPFYFYEDQLIAVKENDDKAPTLLLITLNFNFNQHEK